MTAFHRDSTPKLRPVEAFPVQTQRETLTCLRDPQGLAEKPIFLNAPQAFLVSQMDGTRSLGDIQADFFRKTAEILPMDALEKLVQRLDEQHYLISPAFRAFFDELVQEFRNAPVRPAFHAGLAYQEDANRLRLQLDGYYTDPNGPGPVAKSDAVHPIRGLISPHIDFHRGGPAYAHAYKALAEQPAAERFIVFGTCHSPMARRFALTEKDYATPLGNVETDRDFVRRLSATLPQDYFQDEFAHRAEHSIEFQTVCLRHSVRGEFKIVPILVGSFQDMVLAGNTPSHDAEVCAMIQALQKVILESSGRSCIIAGADLAHVGRQFGDPAGPTEASLREVEREDRKFLELVMRGEAEDAFRFIAAERDRRRVCGWPPIYMMLRSLENPAGRLLDYRQWADLGTGAAVTFAGAAFC